MKTNTVLQRLDLARNSITDAGEPARTLPTHALTLTLTLNLTITDAGEPLTLSLTLAPGARALALALHLNSSLEYLNLESNVVAEKGGKVRVRVRIRVRVRVFRVVVLGFG